MGYRRQIFFVLTLSLSCLLAACGRVSNQRSGWAGLSSESPELYMKDMHLREYAEDGLAWEMDAKIGEGYTAKNWMRVKDMHVTLYQHNERSTDITADRAITNTGQTPVTPVGAGIPAIVLQPADMYVFGNVVAVSTDGSRMITDWAHYHKRTELITSTAPVRMERSDSITSGIGMEATSDLSNIRIFEQTLVVKQTPRKTKTKSKPPVKKRGK